MNRTLLILLAISGALTLAGFYYHPALGVFMLGGMVLLGVSIWNGGQKMLALYRAREGEDFNSFLAALPDADPKVALAVYEEVQAVCSSQKHPLPLRPTDHAINDLMLDLEELFTEVLPRIITRIGHGDTEGMTDLNLAGIIGHFSTPKTESIPASTAPR